MIKYLRIVTVHGERFTLRVTADNSRGVTGYEVDEDGEEVVPAGGMHDRRLRVVPRAAIKTTKEYVMNTTYARLERVKP